MSRSGSTVLAKVASITVQALSPVQIANSTHKLRNLANGQAFRIPLRHRLASLQISSQDALSHSLSSSSFAILSSSAHNESRTKFSRFHRRSIFPHCTADSRRKSFYMGYVECSSCICLSRSIKTTKPHATGSNRLGQQVISYLCGRPVL